MQRSIFLLIFIFLFWTGLPARAEEGEPLHYRSSINKLKKVQQTLAMEYPSHPWKSFYCQCEFRANQPWSCQDLRIETVNKIKTYQKQTLSWEHLLPASWMAQALGVKRGSPVKCLKPNKPTKNKWKACETAEELQRQEEYLTMEGDPYNLVPAVLPANMARRNYPFTLAKSEDFQGCALRISKVGQQARAEIPKHRLGDVARAYQHMLNSYPIVGQIKHLKQKDWEEWAKDDPITPIECRRYELILVTTNRPNEVLANACEALWQSGLVKQ